jgi:peptidyl-tRNA hydrolase, PTH1 family
VVALPLTYMNKSGTVIPSLMRASRASRSDLVVISDNMDLPPGTVRVKRKGVSRSHNGLASVMDAVGTGEFVRVYIGIGRPADSSKVVEHVLSLPPESERALYEHAIEQAADACLALVDHDVEWVMNMISERQ